MTLLIKNQLQHTVITNESFLNTTTDNSGILVGSGAAGGSLTGIYGISAGGGGGGSAGGTITYYKMSNGYWMFQSPETTRQKVEREYNEWFLQPEENLNIKKEKDWEKKFEGSSFFWKSNF